LLAASAICLCGNAVDSVSAAQSGATLKSGATWIWYPGDYEIWLGNRMNDRRTERGAFYPCYMWQISEPYGIVEFAKVVTVEEDEEVEIYAEGRYNVRIDGRLEFGSPKKFKLSKGSHSVNIQVMNRQSPPTLFLQGKTVVSDGTWSVCGSDKMNRWGQAGSWNFNTPQAKPSEFKMSTELHKAVSVKNVDEGTLYDFGKETFGYFQILGLSGEGALTINYGESVEEALDKNASETIDVIRVSGDQVLDETRNSSSPLTALYTLESKAFRYICISKDEGVKYDDVQMLYEFLPEEYRGSFRCNDEEINKIWDVAAYTMHLTTREFFIDGIKRDRWVWSGDALQSYLMNFYLFFDQDTTKRTLWMLRGKDPVGCHINTILDYTFYWFIGIYDYYLYTGDKAFLQSIYPRMQTLMDFVLSRTDKDGMVEGYPDDWVFIDWVDGPMDKSGQTSFEQILFCRSLETMSLCAKLVDNKEDIEKYSKLSKDLRAKLEPFFWNDEKQAFINNLVNGKSDGVVTRYANMFAIFFGYLSPEKQQAVKQSVILNDNIMKITTPYMQFYQLEALCAMGEQSTVLKNIKDYWGGMLNLGATSFWEKYVPTETGTQHLAMYARPYAKSLCHAWGSSPIYLLGRYYLGVEPTKPGYAEYRVKPVLGGLEWMKGTVPTPKGNIEVFASEKEIRIHSEIGIGTLCFECKKTPTVSGLDKPELKDLGNGNWELTIESGKAVKVLR